MILISLLLLIGLFSLALFLLKALGWVIVTGFHLVGVFILALIIEGLFLYYRRKYRRRHH